jgi:hypothetical protein
VDSREPVIRVRVDPPSWGVWRKARPYGGQVSDSVPGEPAQPKSNVVNPQADDPILIAALGHASSWVDLRTTHRNQGINFFLLSIAFMFAAYVASMNNDENTLAGCIGLIGAVGSLLFWQQDLRLRAVLRAGVRPLRDVQKVLAKGWRSRRSRSSG